MGPRGPNRQLAALLAESGWSAGELARAVNALGTKYGLRLRYDRTAVAHWLEGSRPRPPVPGLVAQVFGRRLGRPVRVGETGLESTTTAGASAEAVLRTGDPVERLTALCAADADPARRLALNREMFTAADVRLPAWPPAGGPLPGRQPGTAQPGSTHGGTAQSGTAQSGAAQGGPAQGGAPQGRAARGESAGADARLADMVTVFAELAAKYGGAHARSALGAYVADDVAQRLTASSPGSGTAGPADPAVLTGSACLMHLLGTMAADSGLPNLGYHCYRAALDLAHRAEDRNVYAITLRTMAVLALRLDDLPHARQWSQLALETAASTPSSHVRTYLYAGRALVRACDDERKAALADLLAAERYHDTEPRREAADDPLEPFTRYPTTAFHYQRGETLLSLGDRAQAAAAFQESLAVRPPAHHIALVLTHARLAELLLALGELEAALDQCARALAHYPYTASRRTTTALTALRRVLAPYRRHPQARGVRDQVARLTHSRPAGSGGVP
ncbi:tetratricopeptide repeat protein [Streptomyces sp. NPDC053499]|uniref:tetratricopeptide repeat protein n=1 Tax=Streptomyces sp. NPDC053499 TaxID=3365707 RepID=UPI0037D82FC7